MTITRPRSTLTDTTTTSATISTTMHNHEDFDLWADDLRMDVDMTDEDDPQSFNQDEDSLLETDNDDADEVETRIEEDSDSDSEIDSRYETSPLMVI